MILNNYLADTSRCVSVKYLALFYVDFTIYANNLIYIMFLTLGSCPIPWSCVRLHVSLLKLFGVGQTTLQYYTISYRILCL